MTDSTEETDELRFASGESTERLRAERPASFGDLSFFVQSVKNSDNCAFDASSFSKSLCSLNVDL